MFVKFRSRVTRFATTTRIAMPKFVQSRCSRPIFPSGQTLRDVTTPIIDRPVYKLNLSSRSRGSSSQRTSTSGYRYPPLSRRSYPPQPGNPCDPRSFRKFSGAAAAAKTLFFADLSRVSRVLFCPLPAQPFAGHRTRPNNPSDKRN